MFPHFASAPGTRLSSRGLATSISTHWPRLGIVAALMLTVVACQPKEPTAPTLTPQLPSTPSRSGETAAPAQPGITTVPAPDSTSAPGGQPSDQTPGTSPSPDATEEPLGGLPAPDTALSPQQVCDTLSSNFPEDRTRIQGTSVLISLSVNLIDRLQATTFAMQGLQQAQSLEVAHCLGQDTLDVLVGRVGRYSSSTAFSPGALPLDQEQLNDPGLAMALWEVTANDRVKSLISTTILGNIDQWRNPSARWGQIASAVQSGGTSTSNLDGRVMRLVVWGVLARDATSVATANQVGTSGLADARAGLDAAHQVFDAQCSDVEDARCP